ncbi:MAG: hypothetical protein ACRCZS_06835 [Chroococcidiopsis sp.]
MAVAQLMGILASFDYRRHFLNCVTGDRAPIREWWGSACGAYIPQKIICLLIWATFRVA